MEFVYIVEKVYAWDDRETFGYFSTLKKAKEFKKECVKGGWRPGVIYITKQEVK